MYYYNNGSQTDCFKILYNAHTTIFDMKVKIVQLYESASSMGSSFDGMPKSPNPHRFENIMVEICYLQNFAKQLLKLRAEFDLFVCTLTPFYATVLALRCEECRSWKEIASECNISTVSAKRVFKKICDRAQEAGLFELPVYEKN